MTTRFATLKLVQDYAFLISEKDVGMDSCCVCFEGFNVMTIVLQIVAAQVLAIWALVDPDADPLVATWAATLAVGSAVQIFRLAAIFRALVDPGTKYDSRFLQLCADSKRREGEDKSKLHCCEVCCNPTVWCTCKGWVVIALNATVTVLLPVLLPLAVGAAGDGEGGAISIVESIFVFVVIEVVEMIAFHHIGVPIGFLSMLEHILTLGVSMTA